MENHQLRIRDRFGLKVFNIFFLEITEQCKEMGLVKGERVMTDGTLFQASAFIPIGCIM
jgi:hypothetical protein